MADEGLSCRPVTGQKRMTVGQLLMHCASFGFGKAIQGLVRGEWGLPDGCSVEDWDAAQHVPPAASLLPTVESVAQARQLLAN